MGQFTPGAGVKKMAGGYPKTTKQACVFIIMAGNIPLVGLHDFLSAYLTGSKLVIKAASNDLSLMKWVILFLNQQAPSSASEIQIVDAYKEITTALSQQEATIQPVILSIILDTNHTSLEKTETPWLFLQVRRARKN